MTSSVTATTRSPKVVLITFGCRIFYSSTHSPHDCLVRSTLVDMKLLQIGRINVGSKRRTRVDRRLKNFRVLRNQDLTMWWRRASYKESRDCLSADVAMSTSPGTRDASCVSRA